MCDTLSVLQWLLAITRQDSDNDIPYILYCLLCLQRNCKLDDIRRKDCEPGCLLVRGASQMLPLAKKYFYPSLNDAITANELKWAM